MPFPYANHDIDGRGPDLPPTEIQPSSDSGQTSPLHWSTDRDGDQRGRFRRHTTLTLGTIPLDVWWNRTGWRRYLGTLEPEDVYHLAQKPAMDDDINPKRLSGASLLWYTMGEVFTIARERVASASYHLRQEAAWVERRSNNHSGILTGQPGCDGIMTGAYQWQRIVTVFYRSKIQNPRIPRPRYRFTEQQLRSWRELYAAIGAGYSEPPDMPSSPDANEHLDPTPPLTTLQAACLEFCIQLLNQWVMRRDYDSPLICALCMLATTNAGFVSPDGYITILSDVIGTSRYLVLLHAWIITNPDPQMYSPIQAIEWKSIRDGLLKSRIQDAPGTMGVLRFMMDRFMTIGTYSPMHWMLDLHAFGVELRLRTGFRYQV